MIESLPLNQANSDAATGDIPTGWYAEVLRSGGGISTVSDTTVYVYVICAAP